MTTVEDSNTTEIISFATSEISLPRGVRFWILLIPDIPSIACTLFVLAAILTDRKSRSSVKNHSIILILILGLGCQLIDIPFYLNFIIHSQVVPSNPSICRLWWFIYIGMYDGTSILMAWTALERHIIVFHDRWISTTKTRILVHYLPLIIFLLYIFGFYIYAIYYFSCENTYDYTLPVCNSSPCYTSAPFIGIWDLVVNTAGPSLLEAFFSLAFIFRVVWQKWHCHARIQWRKQRKMAIQLLSFSFLNISFVVPLSIINLAHLFGLSPDIGVDASQYFYFLCYFVILVFPFICLASIGDVKKKFREKILRQRRRRARVTATVRPVAFNVQASVES